MDNVEEDKNALEEKVSAIEGLREVGKMFTYDQNQLVESDDEYIEKIIKDTEKRLEKSTDSVEKNELKKELLILQILVLQREKIDKEAAVILNSGDAFGRDLENEKVKEKKKKERDKKQKALIEKLNELGNSSVDKNVNKVIQTHTRGKGGMEKEQRTR